MLAGGFIVFILPFLIWRFGCSFVDTLYCVCVCCDACLDLGLIVFVRLCINVLSGGVC